MLIIPKTSTLRSFPHAYTMANKRKKNWYTMNLSNFCIKTILITVIHSVVYMYYTYSLFLLNINPFYKIMVSCYTSLSINFLLSATIFIFIIIQRSSTSKQLIFYVHLSREDCARNISMISLTKTFDNLRTNLTLKHGLLGICLQAIIPTRINLSNILMNKL